MAISELQLISRKQSRALILDMARYGENRHNISATAADEAIIAWFEQNGEPFAALVDRLRVPIARVPFVENLMGPNWTFAVSKPGVVSASVEARSTRSASITSSGTLSTAAYLSAFNSGLKSLRRAVDETSYPDLLQALASGFASLEAFISLRAAMWNDANDTRALREPPNRTFDHKIDEWLPTMHEGKRYDKGRADWSILKTLRAIRDKDGIHPEAAAFVVADSELADLINKYHKGISETLFQLHMFFEMRVPSSIVRARYAPAVYES